MGFTFCTHELDLLNDTAQYKLFRRILAEQHCLHHLFTIKPRRSGAMQLIQHGHNFILLKYEFNKHHFIARSLFIVHSLKELMCKFQINKCVTVSVTDIDMVHLRTTLQHPLKRTIKTITFPDTTNHSADSGMCNYLDQHNRSSKCNGLTSVHATYRPSLFTTVRHDTPI